jgi:hypothetical protein
MSKSRSRRGRRTVPASSDSPSSGSGDYWEDFLRIKGLRGMVPAEELYSYGYSGGSGPAAGAGAAPSGELRIFAERLIYALCPPEKGYAPLIVKEVKSIYDVLAGRKDFSEWFKNVRQMLSLKGYQLASVIYDCLEGLRSKEARELRDQWFGYIQAELKGYGLL